MPQNKSHHFVPQFMLRNFSTDGSSIGLYNLRSGNIVTGASLKHQACRDWFYGRDGKAERSLSEIEGAAAKILRRMIEAGKPPKRYSDDHRALATFLLIQSARTAQAAAEANEMIDKVGKLLLRNSLTDSDLLAAIEDMTIELTEPAAEALRPVVLQTPVILDLRIKLIDNLSTTPFVLGDHPAIKHNGLYRASDHSVLGLANVGLQFLMPISPKYAVILYDDNAYSLGSPASNVVKLSAPNIAMALNDFQWANALQNVYFRPGSDAARWVPASDHMSALRLDKHFAIDEKQVRLDVARQAKIINAQTHRPSRTLKMPLFRNRIAAPQIVDTGMLPLRDPQWVQHVQVMIETLQAGVIPPEEFHCRTQPPRFIEQVLRERAASRASDPD